MKEKFIYIVSLFLFLVIELWAIKQNGYWDDSQAIIVVPSIILLMLFCAVIIFISREVKKVRYFAVLTIFTSIALGMGLIEGSFFYPMTAIVISFLPYLIYKLFITFNLITTSMITLKINRVLFIQSLIAASLLLLNFEKFTWIIGAVLALDIFGCFFLYLRGKDRLTIQRKKEQALFIRIVILALVSLVISTSILSGVALLLIPMTVAIILFKRNDIQLNKRTIAVNLVTQVICISGFFLVNFHFLHLSMFAIYVLSLFYCVILFLFYLKNWYLSKIEVKRMQQRKTDFQKEKIELAQTMSKERTLSSVGTLMGKLLLQQYAITNYSMIWKDHYQPYILASEGEFTKLVLTNKVIAELERNTETFFYRNNQFRKFPFWEDDQLLGWLLMDQGKAADTADRGMKDLVGVVGQIIRENECLYDMKQEALKIESVSYDEYVNYEYLNRVQNFHKDFSFFLHDNVLQNILALKKLIESITTENLETKKLVLETFDTLNKTFRDKIFELYPSTIETVPLSQSIQLLCDKYNETQEAMFVHFYCPEEINIKKEDKFHIYRIIQELITNALKHSQATDISVALNQSEFFLECIVQDNGIGFDYGDLKLNEFEQKHFGILSINQEVNSLNGKMRISSVNPQGTKVSITFPMAKEEVSS